MSTRIRGQKLPLLVRGWAFANSLSIPILPHPKNIIKLYKAVFSHRLHTQTGLKKDSEQQGIFLYTRNLYISPISYLTLKLPELEKNK